MEVNKKTEQTLGIISFFIFMIVFLLMMFKIFFLD